MKWMTKLREATKGNVILPVVYYNNQSMDFQDGWVEM